MNLRCPTWIEDPGQLRPGSSSRRRVVEPPGTAEDQGQAEAAGLLKGAGNEVVEDSGEVDVHCSGLQKWKKPASE